MIFVGDAAHPAMGPARAIARELGLDGAATPIVDAARGGGLAALQSVVKAVLAEVVARLGN